MDVSGMGAGSPSPISHPSLSDSDGISLIAPRRGRLREAVCRQGRLGEAVCIPGVSSGQPAPAVISEDKSPKIISEEKSPKGENRSGTVRGSPPRRTLPPPARPPARPSVPGGRRARPRPRVGRGRPRRGPADGRLRPPPCQQDSLQRSSSSIPPQSAVRVCTDRRDSRLSPPP